MKFSVSSHVFRPGECSGTQVTFVRLQPSVGEQVAFEILIRGIGITANFTYIRLLTRMVPFMYHQLILSVVGLMTKLAAERRKIIKL